MFQLIIAPLILALLIPNFFYLQGVLMNWGWRLDVTAAFMPGLFQYELSLRGRQAEARGRGGDMSLPGPS